MKIKDIYLFNESLDKPLNYSKIGNGRYLIDVDDKNKLIVNLVTRNISDLNLMSVLFRDPNSEKTKLTNLFDNSIRVFSTITEIVFSIPNIDIIFFIPDDVEVEIENKKLRLYQLISARLVKQNKLVSSGILDFDELRVIFGILPKSKANFFTDEQIKSIDL